MAQPTFAPRAKAFSRYFAFGIDCVSCTATLRMNAGHVAKLVRKCGRQPCWYRRSSMVKPSTSEPIAAYDRANAMESHANRSAFRTDRSRAAAAAAKTEASSGDLKPDAKAIEIPNDKRSIPLRLAAILMRKPRRRDRPSPSSAIVATHPSTLLTPIGKRTVSRCV